MNKFSKYQGAGNDFVMIDDRLESFRMSQGQIARLCDRHFGIGADGLILIRNSSSADYEMVYHNADGAIGSMCGNGARCTYQFAVDLGIIGDKATFIAYDGLHTGWTRGKDISISMREVEGLEFDNGACILNTGSPHYVKFVDDLSQLDVVAEGRAIRYGARFRSVGINVNFVEIHADHLRVSTYERGVEDRTLACGTGVTAVALAHAMSSGLLKGPVSLHADGGKLQVDFTRAGDGFKDIVLTGPAEKVFEGYLSL